MTDHVPPTHPDRNDESSQDVRTLVRQVDSQLLIKASAGTGKTYQLSNRYIAALMAGVEPDRILATTFTRKAAAEILDRILLRLAEAASDRKQRAELAEAIGHDELTEDRCSELLMSLVRSFHRLRISTLDAFFAQLAGAHSLELGLIPGWRMCGDNEHAVLQAEAIQQLLEQGDAQQLLHLVNRLSKGSAGRSVNQLIHQKVNDLFRTYRVTSAEAWDQYPQYARLKNEQLDAACEQLLEASRSVKPSMAKAVRTIVDAARAGQWKSVITQTLTKKVLDGEGTYSRMPIPATFVEPIQQLAEHARAMQIDLLRLQAAAAWELLDAYESSSQEILRRRRVLRFDDVTMSLADWQQSAESRPAGESDFRLDGSIAHLFLDEFQDTSLEQWMVLKPFVANVASQSASAGFFCVGDTKQAIYGWRGGVAEIFDALPDVLPRLTPVPLNTSYRSSPVVIDFVNQVFQGLGENTRNPAVQQWCRDFPQHSSAYPDMPGCVQVVTSARPETPDDEPDAEPETGSSQTTRRRRAPKISVDRWRECIFERSVDLAAELVSDPKIESIGVLTRKNDSVAALIKLFRERGLAASEEGGVSIVDAAPVQLLLSVFQLADHPGDTAAAFHVWHSPLRQLWTQAGVQGFDLESRHAVASWLRGTLATQGYGAAVHGWVHSILPHCSHRDRQRLLRLVVVAEQYDSESTLRPIDFIEYVSRLRVDDPSAQRIRVMNVHQSKGLQFDVVILADLEQDTRRDRTSHVVYRPQPTSAPTTVAMKCSKDVQELLPAHLQDAFEQTKRGEMTGHLCTLYVALTRAASQLIAVLPPRDDLGKQEHYADWICRSLGLAEAVTPDAVLYQAGTPRKSPSDSQAVSVTDSLAASPAQDPSAIELSGPIQFRERDPARVPKWVTPSGLEATPRTQIGMLTQPVRKQALQRGTLIHALFEVTDWSDDGLPDHSVCAAAISGQIRDQAAAEACIQEFETLANQPGMRALLSRARYQASESFSTDSRVQSDWPADSLRLVVQNERPFATRVGAQNVSGLIDRLVLVYDRQRLVWADIVDFKTDDVEGEADLLAERVAYYRGQLLAYRSAVSNVFQLPEDRISAHLAFVQADQVVRVDADRE